MLNKKLVCTLAVSALVVCLLVFPTMASPLVQGRNLLQNPSFEDGLDGWGRWSYDNVVMQTDKRNQIDLDASFYQPYFGLSEPKWDRESRGKDETRAAAVISGVHNTKFRAGLYQTVYVAPGSRVRFSVWMNGFCEDDKGKRCPVILRAGIDPNGGTNWRSNNIRWVETQVGDQQYALLIPPEVQVPNGAVTVFVWGEPRFPVIYNAAYADEASLVVTVPPTPTGAAPTAPPPSPTPTPCARMQVVSEATAPEQAALAPGIQITKTWRVQNSGTCPWSGTLNFVGSGDQMEGPSPKALPQVQVGEIADVILNLTAPMQPGSYQGTWEARTDDGTVLERLVVSIKVADGAITPTPVASSAPQQAEVSPAPATSEICVFAFNDRNGDGQQAAEDPLAMVTFTLSNSAGLNDRYTTDGASEPHCFTTLPLGSYQVAAEPPADYVGTTPETATVELSSGMKTNWAFGAQPGNQASALASTRSVTSSSLQKLYRAIDPNVLIVAAVIILAGLGLAIGIASVNRR